MKTEYNFNPENTLKQNIIDFFEWWHSESDGTICLKMTDIKPCFPICHRESISHILTLLTQETILIRSGVKTKYKYEYNPRKETEEYVRLCVTPNGKIIKKNRFGEVIGDV